MRKILFAAALALTSATALAAPVTYTLDAKHTMVLASWNHFGFSNPSANFGDAKGTLVYDAENPAKSSVEVTLPLSGLQTFVPALNEHLQAADFFDATQFPQATFKSTKVESTGQGTLKVTGDLTIKGITQPVVLDVRLNKAAEHPMGKVPTIGFDATATIKRSDFGLAKYAPMVSDEVQLRITTEATVPKPAK